mmetsp:Transcript_35669/g.40518  ORF Transcript_35669/g.40518 Transcript_35669/m.40518 type:complete len:126 (+) Transcript_35669:145-522(+)
MQQMELDEFVKNINAIEPQLYRQHEKQVLSLHQTAFTNASRCFEGRYDEKTDTINRCVYDRQGVVKNFHAELTRKVRDSKIHFEQCRADCAGGTELDCLKTCADTYEKELSQAYTDTLSQFNPQI